MSRRGVILLVVGLFLLIAVGFVLASHFVMESKMKRLRETARRIQVSMEKFAFDSGGAYPNDFNALPRKGYLDKLPDNPFGKGSLIELQPGDPPVPGGFVYIPVGVLVMLPSGELVDSATYEGDLIMPTEIDRYVLIFYGPWCGKYSEQGIRSTMTWLVDTETGFETITHPAEELDRIAWERVCLVLTAGEEIPAGR